MTETTTEWEVFHDPGYFHSWRVRRIGEKDFKQGFSLMNGDEAKALCNLLNAARVA